jgi:hypothetical protein
METLVELDVKDAGEVALREAGIFEVFLGKLFESGIVEG